MLTKRYIVIFAGLGPEKFTEDVLIKTWEDVADRIYLETGIYISARLAMSYMICGDRRGLRPQRSHCGIHVRMEPRGGGK